MPSNHTAQACFVLQAMHSTAQHGGLAQAVHGLVCKDLSTIGLCMLRSNLRPNTPSTSHLTCWCDALALCVSGGDGCPVCHHQLQLPTGQVLVQRLTRAGQHSIRIRQTGKLISYVWPLVAHAYTFRDSQKGKAMQVKVTPRASTMHQTHFPGQYIWNTYADTSTKKQETPPTHTFTQSDIK